VLGAIFRLGEARGNKIRSQSPLFAAKSPACPSAGPRTRCFAFIKAHLCRRRLSHLQRLRPGAGRAAVSGMCGAAENDALGQGDPNTQADGMGRALLGRPWACEC
jgi:hypothetical protein